MALPPLNNPVPVGAYLGDSAGPMIALAAVGLIALTIAVLAARASKRSAESDPPRSARLLRTYRVGLVLAGLAVAAHVALGAVVILKLAL